MFGLRPASRIICSVMAGPYSTQLCLSFRKTTACRNHGLTKSHIQHFFECVFRTRVPQNLAQLINIELRKVRKGTLDVVCVANGQLGRFTGLDDTQQSNDLVLVISEDDVTLRLTR